MSNVEQPNFAELLCAHCIHDKVLDVWQCHSCLSTFALPVGHLPQACPSCGVTNKGRVAA